MAEPSFRPAILDRRALMVGAGAIALAACSDASTPLDEQGRVRIRFATDWRAQAEHGGFYQALASGAYARRNLNVEIIQGGPGVNVPQLLAAGAVELGMGSNSFIPLNLVAEGAPV
ncbi:MAG: nitrate ABC transporter substrate-binding protein, partial [Alphaproteobacteria bacterium]